MNTSSGLFTRLKLEYFCRRSSTPGGKIYVKRSAGGKDAMLSMLMWWPCIWAKVFYISFRSASLAQNKASPDVIVARWKRRL